MVVTDDLPRTKRPPAVFLQDFVDVRAPLEAIRSRLAAGADWLGPLACAAGDDGATLLVRIGPAAGGDLIAREARVRLGEVKASLSAVHVPVRWEDARHPGLFPVLDGDLEVVALAAEECRIVLHATYRPPLDGVGHLLNVALLHRVAESTARSFLQRVGAVLEAPVEG